MAALTERTEKDLLGNRLHFVERVCLPPDDSSPGCSDDRIDTWCCHLPARQTFPRRTATGRAGRFPLDHPLIMCARSAGHRLHRAQHRDCVWRRTLRQFAPDRLKFQFQLIILLDRSLAIGDYIKLQDGRARNLRQVSMHSATLEALGGEDFTVPNEQFITTSFTN